jgi:PTS system glucose-specific IIA component
MEVVMVFEKLFGKSKNLTKIVNLASPLTGKVIALEDVPDPVFSRKLAGDGIAVNPIGNQLVSPIDATVTQLFHTRHAVGLTTSEGIQILLHIGIDTVKLNGRGFKPSIVEGDKVKTGDLLITFDRDLLMAEASSIITPMLITNMDQVESLAVEAGKNVTAGEEIILTLTLKSQ